jgi:hypothetical protein
MNVVQKPVIYLGPRAFRAIDAAYWLSWVPAFAAFTFSLYCGDALSQLLAACLLLAALVLWAIFPLPYPGSKVATLDLIHGGQAILNFTRPYRKWNVITLITESALDEHGEVAALSCMENHRLWALDRANFTLSHSTLKRLQRIAVVDLNGCEAVQVTLKARGKWEIIAGENASEWKDARISWILASRARRWLCGAGLVALSILLAHSLLRRG